MSSKELPKGMELIHDEDDLREINLLQSRLLEETNVQISIKLGEVTLSVAELLDLMPGRIVQLPEAVDSRVTLMVGEEEVATARLVKREDENQTSQYEYGLEIETIFADLQKEEV